MLIVTCVSLFAGLSLYLFVLRSISNFTHQMIQDTFSEMTNDLYDTCDLNLKELSRDGQANDEKALRMKKAFVLELIEHFMKRNRLKGAVLENERKILSVGNPPEGLSETIEIGREEKQVNFLNYKGEKYYTDHIEFTPWGWHIVIARGMSEYAPIVHRVRMAYGITGTILPIFIILLLYYLNRAVKLPISTIIGQLKKGEKPDYKGIVEFEYLSASLRDIIELRERETKMLNNIYHIAVSRRGDEFFREAVMSIERVFGLNAYIGKLIDNGKDVDVVAMYLNGN